MKLRLFFISISIGLLFPTLLISQNIKIGLGGGYAYIDNDTYYTRNIGISYFPNQLGMRDCYTINAKLKYAPLNSPIIFIGELFFLSASKDVDYLGYYALYQSSPAKMHLNASQNIYSLGVGIEAPIIKSFVTPYFSIGIMANYFGKTKVVMTPKPDMFFDRYGLVISDKLRAGLNIGLGVEYKFIEKMSLDISAKYNFINLVGKENITEKQNEESFNTFSISAIIFYSF